MNGDLSQLPGINDEDLTRSTPMVRALVVARLEQMWASCEPFIGTTVGKPDPRFIEAGIRINDRLIALYNLTKPAAQSAEPDAESRIDERALLKAQVSELESRISG